MSYKIRSWLTFSEEILANETGQPADGAPVRKLAVVCVLENPYAGRFSEDLSLLVKESPALGREFGRRLVALSDHEKISSYGKACIVGVEGEYEHGNALLTTAFADPVRDAVGGGKAWISSITKRAAPGATIDIPLAHKDALYVRSHYDGITITLPDTPLPNEIAVICAFANRGRPNHRVGGLAASDIKGVDGLT